MNKQERQALKASIDVLARWTAQARSEYEGRREISTAADDARAALGSRVLSLRLPDGSVSAVPLDVAADLALARSIHVGGQLPELRPADAFALSLSRRAIDTDIAQARASVGGRRFFQRKGNRRRSEDAAVRLRAMVADEHAGSVEEALDRMARSRSQIQESRIEDPAATLSRAAFGGSASLVAPAETLGARAALAAWRKAHRDQEMRAESIIRTANEIRDREVRRLLAEMPLDALKRSTGGRVRLGVLANVGFSSVKDVLDHGPMLYHYDGVGERSAAQIWGAAESMRTTLQRETPVRIDVKAPDTATRGLLIELGMWGPTSALLAESSEARRIGVVLAPLLDAHGAVSHLALPDQHQHEVLLRSLSRLAHFGDQLGSTSSGAGSDPWKAFLSRPADYLGWLRDIGFLTEDEASAHGSLSEELVAKVRAQDLDTSLLQDVSLRGYQDFGARFALVQRRVIIGDEMGLGKTIEAMAMLAHVHAKGETHSVVVCPAAVVNQWVREIEDRSKMSAYRMHGGDRDSAVRHWHRRGGVAVTTFETLCAIRDEVLDVREIAALAVDEAHYIKNPLARRTQNVRALIDYAKRTLLLSGTPLENRLDEFENLVSYLQPDLLNTVPGATTTSFQRQVAPAYLRRNQEDVLTELPDRIEVEEWLPMSAGDLGSYVPAVREGNFMAMRRAAMLSGAESVKMARLAEIVAEARANSRKVIVFSYFRDVLSAVVDRLDGIAFGPMTGSVAAADRQRLVDEFTDADPGAVLVAQITAGGVGLNIQAGSVVILCEPQVKPSMEDQAVARAHRMGQVETVQVHKLLSEDAVDQRMLEILAHKREIFDGFVRESLMARSAPEAVDISEAELSRAVINDERERMARRERAMADQDIADEIIREDQS